MIVEKAKTINEKATLHIRNQNKGRLPKKNVNKISQHVRKQKRLPGIKMKC